MTLIAPKKPGDVASGGSLAGEPVPAASGGMVEVLTEEKVPFVPSNSFDEILAGTADDFLTEFGELITVLPPAGANRQIWAIVDREQPAEMPGIPNSKTTMTTIVVANNATTGISSGEIDIGKGWKVEISTRMGGAVKEKAVTAIVYHNAGLMKLKLR